MKSKLAWTIFNIITVSLGSVLTIYLFLAGTICSIYGLIQFSAENRIFFKRLCRIVGVIVVIFGLLLPFRDISFVGTLLCFWWGSFLFHLIKKYEFYQGIGSIICNLIFWVYHLKHQQNISFLQNAGDIIIFVILPSVFVLVCLTPRNALLDLSEGPSIPLDRWISKLGNFISTITTPNNK